MSYEAPRDFEAALHLLAERLALSDAPRVTLLVCGGAALRALGYVIRTTKDVDVVALIEHDAGNSPRARSAKPLPDTLADAVAAVARDLRLRPDWLNAEPASLLDFGLPEGCLERAVMHENEYGDKLSICFVDRIDQIHFKLYAAVDGGSRDIHVEDLRALNPTDEELLVSARWARTHDPSDGFRMILASFLRYLGHAELAEKI